MRALAGHIHLDTGCLKQWFANLFWFAAPSDCQLSYLTSFRFRRCWMGLGILSKCPDILKHSWATILWDSLVKGACISIPRLKELIYIDYCWRTMRVELAGRYNTATEQKPRTAPSGQHTTLPQLWPGCARYGVTQHGGWECKSWSQTAWVQVLASQGKELLPLCFSFLFSDMGIITDLWPAELMGSFINKNMHSIQSSTWPTVSVWWLVCAYLMGLSTETPP